MDQAAFHKELQRQGHGAVIRIVQQKRILLLAAEIEGKLGNESGREEYVNQLLRQFPESPEARRALSSG